MAPWRNSWNIETCSTCSTRADGCHKTADLARNTKQKLKKSASAPLRQVSSSHICSPSGPEKKFHENFWLVRRDFSPTSRRFFLAADAEDTEKIGKKKCNHLLGLRQLPYCEYLKGGLLPSGNGVTSSPSLNRWRFLYPCVTRKRYEELVTLSSQQLQWYPTIIQMAKQMSFQNSPTMFKGFFDNL